MADEIVTDSAGEATDNSSTDTIDAGAVTESATEETTSILDAKAEKTDAVSTETKDITPDWPEDWRDKLAKGDDKVRKRLDRFQSPADVMKSWQSLEQKLSSGDVKSTLPEDADEKQIADYRKDNGIPETPEGYLENLPNGLVIGDEDRPMVDSYIERVHGKHADPAVVAETLDWYYQLQEDQIAKQAQADATEKQENDDVLRAEWGGEYRGNLNSIAAFLDQAPASDDGVPLKDLILGSRLSDGTPVGNHPTMLRWLARIASDANPAGFVTPGAGGSQAESVKTEIASIEKVMREDRSTYDKDPKMQERLRTLYDAETKLSA